MFSVCSNRIFSQIHPGVTPLTTIGSDILTGKDCEPQKNKVLTSGLCTGPFEFTDLKLFSDLN